MQDEIAEERRVALDPDVVLPMHCSGSAFPAGVAKEMPEKPVLCNTGSRFTFGA